MDLPQSTPQDVAVFGYELMDFSDISSDLPDTMTMTSDDNIPDLVDSSDSEHLDNIIISNTEYGLHKHFI